MRYTLLEKNKINTTKNKLVLDTLCNFFYLICSRNSTKLFSVRFFCMNSEQCEEKQMRMHQLHPRPNASNAFYTDPPEQKSCDSTV